MKSLDAETVEEITKVIKKFQEDGLEGIHTLYFTNSIEETLKYFK